MEGIKENFDKNAAQARENFTGPKLPTNPGGFIPNLKAADETLRANGKKVADELKIR
jgi:hypothetical protein